MIFLVKPSVMSVLQLKEDGEGRYTNQRKLKGGKMAIDQFTKEEFEEYLANNRQTTPFESLGLVNGEYSYLLPLDNQVDIIIRSSIGANGQAANTGKDSIRAWLALKDGSPLGSKIDSWTKRTVNWREVLLKKIDELISRRIRANDCPTCGKPIGIYKRKDGKGIFPACFDCQYFPKYIKNNFSKTSQIRLDKISEKKVSKLVVEEPETVEISEISQQEDNTGLITFLQEAETIEPTEVQPKKSFAPNTKQLEAIEKPIDANVRVFAGPGAGKTFTIAHRYAYLVESGVNPDNILAITFSKTMADELGQKIQKMTPGANLNQISTIHAFCYRELCRNDESSKYFGWQVPGKSAPLKSWQVNQKVKDLIGQHWTGDEKPGYREVLGWIYTSKHHGIPAGQCRKWFMETLGAYLGNSLANIRKDFDNWLYGYKCLEFADMLYLMEQELIGNPDFKTKLQHKYTHIIIDESQDTNYQAFQILFHILENNTSLFLVGDVNQMMYRFQGAKPELITDEISEKVETVILETNYRSNNEIINSFQNLIRYNYSDNYGPYPQEFFQDISGIKGNGGNISFNMADTIFEEGTLIASEIENILQNEYEPGDIFVGARTKAQLGYLEGELFRKSIRYINIAGGCFWDSHHIKNVVGYLRLANGDDKALKTVANIASNDNVYTWNDKQGKFKAGDYCPVRYLGEKFLEKIGYKFDNIDRFLMTAHDAWRYKTNDKFYNRYGPSKAQDLQEFVWSLKELVLQADNVGQIIEAILDDCYIKYLKTTEGSVEDEENNILDNLKTVVEVAVQYTSVDDFLSYVDDMIQASQDAKEKNWDDYVVISTYHRLKGLERKVIFGMGWCEGEDKFGEPVGLLPHTFSLKPPPQFGVLPTSGQSPVEDERCIAFVCVSRAMERVVLTGCREYRNGFMEPSRFIREMMGGR